MSKLKFLILIIFLSGLFLPLNVNAEEVNGVELKVKKVVKQILPIEESMPESVIKTYTDGGWSLNEDLKQLERVVTYQGEEIEVDGEKAKTDSNGEAVFELDNTEDVDVSVKNILTSDVKTKSIEINKQKNETIIYENVDLTGIIKNMGGEEESIEEQVEGDGEVQIGGLKNGQKPKRGAYVHCNRFNGFTGDGRYYSKTKHPVKANINFFQSDCDVALARSFKCLKDYTNSPYCSTKNKSTAGKCSPNIAKHSRLYHKHTGWFSPSK
ncbi:hypothetical protein Saga11_29030 [Bacillus safensis]|nr:hypothetical protein Saga11_29030 [Bacillus safensis]